MLKGLRSDQQIVRADRGAPALELRAHYARPLGRVSSESKLVHGSQELLDLASLAGRLAALVYADHELVPCDG